MTDLPQQVQPATQKTLVLVKPDGLRRGLTGEILNRLERTGMKAVAIKMVRADRDLATRHYRHEDIAIRHGEQIWTQLVEYITEGPVVAIVIEGIAAVAVVRKLCGSTEPATSPPGSIRGDFCHQSYAYCNSRGMAIRNIIHASATIEEATSEISLWFLDEELMTYRRADEAEHLTV